MLTQQEEKLIRRYCVYPKIAVTAVIMALVLGVPFILMEMIDDLVFYDESIAFWGLYVYLGIVALYMIVFCYCTLSTRLGMRREAWQELRRRASVRQAQSDYTAAITGSMAAGAAGRLMQKSDSKAVRGLGAASQVAGAVGAVYTAGAMNRELANNAEAMAAAYRVEVPNTKGLRLAMVLVPLAVLIGVYIPQYVNAQAAKQQNILQVSRQMETLADALEPVCEYVSADDPAERYQTYGYRVIGYLQGMDTDTEKSYVYVSTDTDGTIESITYSEEINMERTPEENISHIEKNFETLHRALQGITVPVTSPELLTIFRLSEEFKTAFLSGSYYQQINLRDDSGDVRIYYSFETESEEEFDEYTSPRVYIYVQG